MRHRKQCLSGNCQNGTGIRYIYENGKVIAKYKGGFRSGQYSGSGQLLQPGFKYKGGFRLGKPHGKGYAIYKGGAKYKGDFVNGKPDGKGIYIVSGVTAYKGGVRAGLYHGRGILVYYKDAKFRKYTGYFVNDKKEGNIFFCRSLID